MTFSLLTEEGIQRYDFYVSGWDAETMVVERNARVGRMTDSGKPYVGQWTRTGEFELTKPQARSLWAKLVNDGAKRVPAPYVI